MARAAAVLLAFVPGATAWALLPTVGFDQLLALGVLALLGGVWTLVQPLPRGFRVCVATFACVTLLGTAGFRMLDLAGSFRPFSTGQGLMQGDLVDLDLPVASEGEYRLDRADADRLRVILNLDRFGVVLWKLKTLSLAYLDEILDNYTHRDPRIVIRCDKELPYQHLGWVASVVAANGYGEVMVGVQRFARTPDDAAAFGVELSGEYWPQLELPVPIVHAGEPRLRLIATGWREGPWPPLPPRGRVDDVPRRMERIATGVLYRLGDRETADLAELAGWMRAKPPKSIEPDPAVPVKFVVAVENEIRKAGHPPAALVLPSPPSDEIWNADHRPYPSAR